MIGGAFREVLRRNGARTIRYGGSGITASVAAARIGAQVAFAGYVGEEDEYAVRAELLAAGVNDSALMSLPGASGTFVYPSKLSSDRPWPMYRPAEAIPAHAPGHIPSAHVTVVFGIPDFDPLRSGWLSHTAGTEVLIWDRQGWLSRARDSSDILSQKASLKVYLANESEAIEETNTSDLEQLLLRMPPAGFQLAVIKRGRFGVIVISESGKERSVEAIPAFVVRTSNSIGSGDVFAGAFAARLALGDSPTLASTWGCAAAAKALREGSNLLGSSAFQDIARMVSSRSPSPSE